MTEEGGKQEQKEMQQRNNKHIKTEVHVGLLHLLYY